MKLLKSIALTMGILMASLSLTAWGLGLLTGSSITKTHSLSSSYSCPTGWYRSNVNGQLVDDLGEIRYDWNKGGAFSADSITVKVEKTAQMGEQIAVSIKIVPENGDPVTGSLGPTQKGSKTISSGLWKATSSTETRFQESTQGSWVKFIGS